MEDTVFSARRYLSITGRNFQMGSNSSKKQTASGRKTPLKNPQLEAQLEGIESYRREETVRRGDQVRETSRDIVYSQCRRERSS